MGMTLLPYGLKGMVYRSPMPFSRFDLGGDLWREYQACEVSTVVMLVGDAEARASSGRPLREMYEREGLQVIQMEIQDYDAPDLEALRRNVRLVKELAESGQNIAIHCHAGVGRTGLFAACLEREIHNTDAEAALAWVRKYVEGAVESDSQRELVKSYRA
jgi:protein-tyrosine phosphatase